jgi:hypothetical protein
VWAGIEIMELGDYVRKEKVNIEGKLSRLPSGGKFLSHILLPLAR